MASGNTGALFTDLYELTMLQAYHDAALQDVAVFELFVRTLPPQRNFLVAAGLDDVLSYLEGLAFGEGDLEYLTSLNLFSPSFLDYLHDFRFTGSVRAVPEGTVVFANEPILEVSGPISEAQLVETYLLDQVNFQTHIASNGARVVEAAPGRPVVDFGARRAHGGDAGLKAARALYISGYASTSLVDAGQRYGIPVAGTMAHSYVQVYPQEIDAFRSFAATYPQTTLLVDTYDTKGGVRNVVQLAHDLGRDFKVRSVRLDSGDLVELAKRTRRILDEAGLSQVQVFASGGLDEYEVHRIVQAGAPVNGFGVGTNVVVSADAPKFDSAYKLVAYGGKGLMKLSTGKATLPGPKQVFRRYHDGIAETDVIARDEEHLAGEPLLQTVMAGGRRLPSSVEPLDAIRQRARRQVESLPTRLRGLEQAFPAYPVEVSAGLQTAERVLRDSLEQTGLREPRPVSGPG